MNKGGLPWKPGKTTLLAACCRQRNQHSIRKVKLANIAKRNVEKEVMKSLNEALSPPRGQELRALLLPGVRNVDNFRLVSGFSLGGLIIEIVAASAAATELYTLSRNLFLEH